MNRNLLSGETSPYLLQHADNPVHWRPWGEAALSEAQAENKPILLSIGYAACHWCHVMAHESFEDPDTAEVMNRLYVNIKVDREERPDLDALYQASLALMGQQGGWPLTIFLTPEGKPFWGGTYFPPADQYGRPAFTSILQQLNETYRNSQDKVTENVKQIDDALQRLASSSPGGDITPATINSIAMGLARQVDPFFGGLGEAPKFPTPSAFALMWRSYLETGAEPFKALTLISLDGMCEGGIYDHLRGGFARYSTDDEWLAPHFEKMLYDNAQIIEVLALAWRGTGSPLYAQRIAETVGWLNAEMLVEGAGIASSLDADSEGEEGKFYVWSEREIDAVLAHQPADRVKAFKSAYDVSSFGNWEGKVILNRRRAKGPYDEDTEAGFRVCRDLLLTIRDGRIKPGWDDKVLADWNGMTIAALADAGSGLDRPDWIAMAIDAYHFIRKNLANGDKLLHSWRGGKAGAPGLLEDYAEMIRAALALYHVTQNRDYLTQAEAWAETVETGFLDPEAGGYFQSPSDRTDLIARMKPTADNAVPSGNGTMMENLSRLAHLTGTSAYRDRAEALIKAFAGAPVGHLSSMGRFLDAVRRDRAGKQVVIVSPNDTDDRPLRSAVYAAIGFDAVLTCLGPDQGGLHDHHPARGKGPIDGKPAAYVCHGMVCSEPVTDPDALTRMLSDNKGPL